VRVPATGFLGGVRNYSSPRSLYVGSIPTASTIDEMILKMTGFEDYFGFGKSKLPACRDVTSCPCTRHRRIRGIGSGLLAQSEAVRFVLRLKFVKWLVEKGTINEGWEEVN